jgi:hypothetical protein
MAGTGGGLIFLEGVLLSSSGFGPIVQFAIFAGLSIGVLSIVADLRIRHRPLLGGLIIVLSLVSLFGLSGFLLGTFIGSLGGTLMVLTPTFSTSIRPGRPAITGADLGPLCRSCGRHVPTWSSTCPYCGTKA